MFCDLVGSTALLTRLDPEELRDELRAYQGAGSGVVARHDGFVAKFMGDGVPGRMCASASPRAPSWSAM